MTIIYYQTGTETGSIADVIATLKPSAPHWSWYDPRPGTLLKSNIPLSTLHPLLRPGNLHSTADIEIDEARLFWPTGSLHLLNTDSQETRYFWWSEQQSDGFEPLEVDQRQSCTILLKDEKAFSRFGLIIPENFWRERIEVIEYWQNSSLVAWTINA